MAAARRCTACRSRSRAARARRSAHREEWDCGNRCRETRRRPRVPVYWYSITVATHSKDRADMPDSGTSQRGEQRSEKQAFLDAWERESATTMKLLRAYPGEKDGLKPHDSCRSAKDLAWTFVFEGAAWAPATPSNMPAMPA